MELFRLFGSIMIDDKDAIKSLNNVDKKGKSTGQKFADVAKKGALIGAAVGGAAIAAGGALLGMANKTAEATDRIDKLSAKTGLSKQAFQEWDYVLGQNGIEIEKMQTGMKTLTANMDAAVSGNENMAGAFDALGVAVTNADGSLRGQEETMNDVILKLADMPNGTEKARLATELFGKAGVELMPMLNNGAQGIEDLKERSHELGLVMSDEAVNAGVVFGDTLDDVRDSLGMVGAKVGVEVMPIVKSFLDWVLANMPMIQTVISTVFGVISTVVSTAVGVFRDYLLPVIMNVADYFRDNMPAIKQFVSDAFTTAKEVIDDAKDAFITITGFIKEHWAVFEPILAGVAAAIVTYKLIALAMGLWTKATGLWTTITGIATGVATAFSAAIAFITSPIGLVVIAIGAAIAIGVALYRNWDTVSRKATELWSAIKTKFNQIKEAISGPINAARDAVRNAIDRIKGFFNFRFKWPKIPMPKFGINPSGWKVGDLLKGSMPKLSVNWNAAGGVFDSPTIFSTNKGLQGVGEAGPEAILPLNDKTYAGMGKGIAEALSGMIQPQRQTQDNRPIVLQVDGKTFAQIIGDYTGAEGGTRIRRIERGLPQT